MHFGLTLRYILLCLFLLQKSDTAAVLENLPNVPEVDSSLSVHDVLRSLQSALTGVVRSLESLEQTLVTAHGNAQVTLAGCSVNDLL